MTTVVLCPHCRKQTSLAPENPFRPFCSDRCKLIDLGSWASEDYKIPTEDTPSYLDEEVGANDPKDK